METSYHVISHSPGTLIGMLSFHSPPLYHSGELGSRAIMLPPVGTGSGSAKIPCGPFTALMMSFSGKWRSALDQSTGGICGARSNMREAAIRFCCEVLGGNIGRTVFC